MRAPPLRLAGLPVAAWLWLVALVSARSFAAGDMQAVRWYTAPPEPPRVLLYLFWAETCPHCLEARAFLDDVSLPWVQLEAHEVSRNADNRRRFATVAAAAGDTPRAVPSLYFCGEAMQGFDSPETTGEQLTRALQECYASHFGTRPPVPGERAAVPARTAPAPIDLPLGGEVDPSRFSLPVLTLLMAALDAINPCAFFVLLFLLSLLTHTHSRRRMLLVGGAFILVSGLAYLLFMSAWLGLFTVLGHLAWLTAAAGTLAVVMGLLSIKDFAHPARGPSLSIGEGHRASLFERTRRVLQQDRALPALAATILLAIAANSYELLCTAGFPMVFTRMLTLAPLSPVEHALYLVAYNVVYVLPLVAILLLYVGTLGRRRLSETEGRTLKLLSGLMMLGLGIILLWRPEALGDPLVAMGLALSSILVSAVAYRVLSSLRGATAGRQREG